ncbi:MAG: beta-lactamase family protein [Williamsia sp.]|nr:beta-lactamase family protein [Williamsia sp.]
MSKIFLLCFVSFLSQNADLLAQHLSDADFTNAKNNIKSQIDNNHVPSIAVAVVKNQKILWEESFGYSNRELKINSTIHTPYYVASVTKLMTAMAVMKLSEKRQINLDSPANKYLLHAKISSPFWNASEATIRRLLQHTSGLTTYDKECYPNLESCSLTVDSAINRYGIVFRKPGTYFGYSNIGYAVLGQIVSFRSIQLITCRMHR